MNFAQCLKNLPPYLFADLDQQKKQARAKGADLIDLSIGDPDLPPSFALIEYLKSALNDHSLHRYPDYIGSLNFRQAAADWLNKRHQVKVDAEKEVTALIGSKEGIAHLIWGTVNPGEVVLVPSPGYPVYSQATIMTGGTPYYLPLLEENCFMPDFDKIPEEVLQKTKLLFLNYPNNPTSACATKEFFKKAIALAKKYSFLICHDAAYIEIYEGEQKPLSILSIPGAKDVAIEMHSFSKTFCITGWRIAFAAGNPDAIRTLAKVKQNVDSGAFMAIERAAVFAMKELDSVIPEISAIYGQRREFFAQALAKMGFKVWPSQASFYVWSRLPQGNDSIAFCKQLLEQAAVVATPGLGFGEHGQGYVRFSLTAATERLNEAAERITRL
ncbi:MAG: LL-diaminopimelate aminotransferase [Pseudomonadota bacterium]